MNTTELKALECLKATLDQKKKKGESVKGQLAVARKLADALEKSLTVSSGHRLFVRMNEFRKVIMPEVEAAIEAYEKYRAKQLKAKGPKPPTSQDLADSIDDMAKRKLDDSEPPPSADIGADI